MKLLTCEVVAGVRGEGVGTDGKLLQSRLGVITLIAKRLHHYKAELRTVGTFMARPGEDVLVRYLSDSLRLVEGVLRKNAPPDSTVSDLPMAAWMGMRDLAMKPGRATESGPLNMQKHPGGASSSRHADGTSR